MIYEWIGTPQGRNIFWLSGMAGTGKSTIARTVAHQVSQDGKLGASFFFSRGGGDLGNASKFVTTLAVQLARNVPDLAEHVRSAVTAYPDIEQKRDQWRYFVLEPLSKLKEGSIPALVFIIDALDECENQDDIRLILQLFAESTISNVKLRIFVTSRPEQPINFGFKKIDGSTHHDMILHDMFRSETEHDIRTFYDSELQAIRKYRDLPSIWPTRADYERLVQITHRLFIFAATVCRFIQNGRFSPEKSLSLVLQEGSTSSSTRQLDKVYLQVLQSSLLDGSNELEQEELLRLFVKIIGSITIAFDVLSAASLVTLLGESISDISVLLDSLRSVLDVPENKYHQIRLLHPSFRDFLFSRERCSDYHFFIDIKTAHNNLARGCLELMNRSLRKDICYLGQPGTLAKDVEERIIQGYISSDLRYACCYWVQHLQTSGSDLLFEDVYKFLKEHLLHWLEALIWLGKASEGVLLLSALRSLVQVTYP